MRTFSIQTLGCRVNHYESQQLAAMLRARGLVEAPAGQADLRIVHSCSVTVQAASKSRQTVRRMVRLPISGEPPQLICLPKNTSNSTSSASSPAAEQPLTRPPRQPRVVVTGCWAASDPNHAGAIPGVDAVLGHDRNVAAELSSLLDLWLDDHDTPADLPANARQQPSLPPVSPNPSEEKVWIKTSVNPASTSSEASQPQTVKRKLEDDENSRDNLHESAQSPIPDPQFPMKGMPSLPLLHQRQTGFQRAFLKIQDGCDAHCTYCIIPQLRPTLWSKPIQHTVEEAQRLVNAGHVELVLTGIFLGAYGHPTALRRRQLQRQNDESRSQRRHGRDTPATFNVQLSTRNSELGTRNSLASLLHSLSSQVTGLKRLRLSSLEPGDLTDDLLHTLTRLPQIVPHFHLPLQSGSDRLLRRMNRQYTRDDYLCMIDKLNQAFDRPAITTDIIVGFPGETDDEFQRTIEVVNLARFIHIHAFSYSPRPNTAAARWTKDFIRGPIVSQRIEHLNQLAQQHSLHFRSSFLGQTVEVLVERDSPEEQDLRPLANHRHGRCERYFAVHFTPNTSTSHLSPANSAPFHPPASPHVGPSGATESPYSKTPSVQPGQAVRVRIDSVTPTHTFATLLEPHE